MVIKVCIGSACHLKGSYPVISRLLELVEKHALDNRVEIKAVFCLGHCVDAVSVQIDDDCIYSVCSADVDEFFYKHVQIAES